MHIRDVLDATVLTVTSGRETAGHRFHHPSMLPLATATDYENSLQKDGHVMADFNLRQETIVEQVNKLATGLGARALIDPDLLDEVTALVEWPNAMLGQFDKEYLQVPQEAQPLQPTNAAHTRWLMTRLSKPIQKIKFMPIRTSLKKFISILLALMV